MQGKKLLDDVSLQELQEMRERGMSNREIAQALDVAYSTIHSILGKQPAGMRRAYGSKHEPQDATETKYAQTETQNKSVLRFVQQTTECEGANNRYTIYGGMGVVTITDKDRGSKVQLDAKGLELYITELLDVLSMISKGGANVDK